MSGNFSIHTSFFPLGIVLCPLCLVVTGFFASSLAKNFLQSLGFSTLTLLVWGAAASTLTERHMVFYDSLARESILKAIIGVPVFLITLLWLAWLNYRNFPSSWVLLRRILLGAIGAVLFTVTVSAGIHNRAWEVFEPAELPHGSAKLSPANPPVLLSGFYPSRDNYLQVQMPDGRLWSGYTHDPHIYSEFPVAQEISLELGLTEPRNSFVESYLPNDTNWVSVSIGAGQFDTVGIKPDGTLWLSDRSGSSGPTAAAMTQFGSETNWQQVASSYSSRLLLKKDGTLWRWGTNTTDWQTLPGLRSLQPVQIGTNSDWHKLYADQGSHAEKTDGTAWRIGFNKKGKDWATRDTEFEQIAPADRYKFTYPDSAIGSFHVRTNGTLWWTHLAFDKKGASFRNDQIGKETNWVSSMSGMGWLVALKSDGTLWQWEAKNPYSNPNFFSPTDNPLNTQPTRMGIHTDWVALSPVAGGAVTLAADGSLWLWPHPNYVWAPAPLIKLPKQPLALGNVFSAAN